MLQDPQGLTYPSEIHGVLHYPATGAGPFPLIVFIHGNHGTCDVQGSPATGYPCPSTPVTGPTPSYRGYDYLGQLLATQGYVTASIDGNAVNTYNVAGDKGANERAQLIARTLDFIKALNDGTATNLDSSLGGDLTGRVDMTRIGLMGHSRGGEGITAFLALNASGAEGAPYPIKAALSLAGTDYNLPSATGTNFATILPLCDGDVYDLQSVFANERDRFAEAAAPFARYVFTISGTDHNFFNTTWTDDGDDFSTSPTAGKCSTGATDNIRLSAADQRRMGVTFVNGFLRRYVGDETQFQSLLDGTAHLPSSACPGGLGPCDNLVGRSYLAPASDRLVVAGPVSDGDPLAVTNEGAPITASGFTTFSYCDPHADNGHDGNSRDPGTNSGCPSNPYRSRARAYTLAWNAPSTLTLPIVDHDVSRFDVLSLRMAANFAAFDQPGGASDPNPGDGATDAVLAVTDESGHEADVKVSTLSDALTPMLPDAARKLTMNGVVLPLQMVAAAGVDLHRVDKVMLRLGAAGQPPTGSIQVTEVAFQHFAPIVVPPALPELPAAALGLLAAVTLVAAIRFTRRTANLAR